MNPIDRKLYLASITDRYVKGKMGRRSFLRAAGKLGLGAGVLGLSSMMPFGSRGGFISPAAAAEIEPDAEMMAWLKDVAKPFAGQTVRLATESTPPSNAINSALKPFFEEATGINVEIEVLPLEQVLQKLTLDIASGNWAPTTSTTSIKVLDGERSRPATFSTRASSMRRTSRPWPCPNWKIEDFLPALVDGIAHATRTRHGRRSLRYSHFHHDVPQGHIRRRWASRRRPRMDEYLANAVAIQEAKQPEIYGTNGQMKSGHYSLECDWTAWLWSHGGSIFNADGKFTGNDEAGLAAMDYWVELHKNMPEGVTTWTWDGQGQSMAQGIVGQTLRAGASSSPSGIIPKLRRFPA